MLKNLVATIAVTAALGAGAQTGAHAGEPPRPTTDFSGDMVVSSEGKSFTIRLAYSAALDKMRTEIKQQGMEMVGVRHMATGEMVMWSNQMPGMAMRLTKKIDSDAEPHNTGETREVNGMSCTVWVYDKAKACLTEDNIPLETDADGVKAHLENVDISAQDESLFSAPSGYKVMDMPKGLPQLPGMPSMGKGLPF